MTKNNSTFIIDNRTAYLKGVNAIVVDESIIDQAKKPTEVKNIPLSGTGNAEIAFWGDGNNFPQKVLELCEKNTVVPRSLIWMMKTLYGKGLISYKESIDEATGAIQIKIVKDKDFEAFKKKNNLKKYCLQAALDFYWFNNIFPEMIVGKVVDKITRLSCKQSSFCRWQTINPKTRRIENMYFGTEWPQSTNVDTIPVYNANKPKAAKKFIYRMQYPSPNRVYYPLMPWSGALVWVEIANLIPKIKKALLETSITIKYHVRIPSNYWDSEYPGFNKLTVKEQQDLKAEKFRQLKEFLTDPENNGAVFVSEYGWNKATNTEFPGWEILIVGDKATGEGKYVTDTSSCNVEIFNALGIDPALPGMSPGGSLGTNNGGSNKREAYLIYVAGLTSDTDFILEPLEFIRDYNKWDPDLKFGFERTVLTTLDANPTGVNKVVS